jgi:hypothetical protein
MPTSLFLARLIGPVMLVIGVSVFANQRGFRDMSEEFLASRPLLFLSGMLMTPAGLAIVLTHNIWTLDWRVLITLLGWLMAVGGALRIFAPKYLLQTGRAALKRPRFTPVAAAIWIVIGLALCFFGYLH